MIATGLDDEAGLAIRLELELLPSGLLRQRATVTAAAEGSYAVDGLMLTLPVPPVATELFDLAGRWGRERSPQRLPFVVGVHSRENRRGRTGPDAPLILAAGTDGFTTRDGDVWAVHVAWSGNHVTYAERLATGAAVLGGGELLLPGEVVLAAGESYRGPWMYAAHGVGLDAVAARFHRTCGPGHSTRRGPGPVVCNTWEAVYFDHDLGRLTELARLAAEVGVERYVLDDGWFSLPPRRHRRTRRLVRRPAACGRTACIRSSTSCRGLGMEFGLWVEPEMINLDSDLARDHPDWILATGGRTAAVVALPAGAEPRPRRRVRLHPRAARRAVDRVPDRVPQVGPQPRSRRRRHRRAGDAGSTCPDPRGLPAARRAARPAPGRGDRVLLVGRSAGRPRDSGAHRPGVGQRRDRPARAPADPALDGAAAAARARRQPRRRAACAHDRPHARPVVPRRDGAVRLVRHRVGPHDGLGCRARGAGRVGGVVQRRCGSCCTPARSCAPRSTTLRSPCTASSPRTGATRCSRSCS